MPKNFVLEIGTEPMPARFVPPALEQLLKNSQALFKENRIAYSRAKTYGTLRRLAVVFEEVSEKSAPLEKEIAGPPARLLKNPDGTFTAQAEGFARKQGLKPENLQVMMTPKGEVLVARMTIPGELTSKVLSRLLPELIASLEFPKTLEWEETRFKFGRPIRSLTALFGKMVIGFKLAGIKSGKSVHGLPAQNKKPSALAEAGRYAATLKNLSILADVEERRETLKRRLEQAAKAAGGRLDMDAELLEETVFMTEHPVPIAGKFDKKFLDLPAQLLGMVMKKQLKFFPLHEGSGLKAGFVGVRDGMSEGQDQVRQGYEKVLTARLSDAAFFLSRDLKNKLEDKLALLKRVTYEKSLGSVADKAARVEKLAASIGEAVPQHDRSAVSRIAKLAYADLVTEVVKEFPELQGAMGGNYARREGLDEKIALGLEQFYYPVGASSPIPETLEGALVSLAAKIDSLCGHFAVGNIPTGSADPFALRRQATGLLRILREKNIPLDLEAALAQALALQPVPVRDEVKAQLSDFIWGRAQTLCEEMGYKVDEIRSVRAGALKNFPQTLLRLAAIHSVRKNPEFEPLAAAFKRAANILRQAKISADNGPVLDRAVLKEEADFSLFDALQKTEGRFQETLRGGDGFEEGLKTLVGLKPHVDLFFEKVMVMVEDPNLRDQRLALLSKLVRLFNSVADLSQIQQSSSS